MSYSTPSTSTTTTTSTAATYEQQVNDTYDQMCASEAWIFFTQLTRRAFSPDVIHVLHNYAASNPHLCLPSHLPLLLSIVGDHVRLALEEGTRQSHQFNSKPSNFDNLHHHHHHRRLAFKRRTLSSRPPISSIPEHAELSDARRTISSANLGPSRAATTGTVDDLFDVQPDRHSISNIAITNAAATPQHREWSKSYRDLDARRKPPPSPIIQPPPITTSLENNANINNIATTISGDTEASFVRSKSLWRGRPKKRNSVRGAGVFSVAPITALLDKRKRNSRSKSPHDTTPTTTNTGNATMTSTTTTM